MRNNTISNGMCRKSAIFWASRRSSFNGHTDCPDSSSMLQFFMYTAVTSYPYASLPNSSPTFSFNT